MKIAIIGSRNFKNLDAVAGKIGDIRFSGAYNPNEVTIISGGAVGVDSEAVQCAESVKLKTEVYKPDYSSFGDNAPHVRNDKIIEEADKVIAFWNGERKSGTYSVISKCLQRRKNIEVIFDN